MMREALLLRTDDDALGRPGEVLHGVREGRAYIHGTLAGNRRRIRLNKDRSL